MAKQQNTPEDISYTDHEFQDLRSRPSQHNNSKTGLHKLVHVEVWLSLLSVSLTISCDCSYQFLCTYCAGNEERLVIPTGMPTYGVIIMVQACSRRFGRVEPPQTHVKMPSRSCDYSAYWSDHPSN